MSSIEHDQGPIPVIDISNPSEEIARQVLDAASKHGFLYIKNDGGTIPPQDIDDMFKLVGSTITLSDKKTTRTDHTRANNSLPPPRNKKPNMPSTQTKPAA